MLDDIKRLLNITSTNRDELLNTIIAITTARLSVLLNTDVIPEKLLYIVTEVSIVRFNRIGSEGLQSHTVEGENMSWISTDSDFDPYMAEIDAFNAAQDVPAKGRVRFI